MDQGDASRSNEDNRIVNCNVEDESQTQEEVAKTKVKKSAKKNKRGIIYLSTIPKYMNVTLIREIFSVYGKVDRVYLQLADNGWFLLYNIYHELYNITFFISYSVQF